MISKGMRNPCISGIFLQTDSRMGQIVADALPQHSDTSFFGHPRGLATLFFTEMWERYSYYGTRALLILYMTAGPQTGGLNFSVMKSGAIYGFYTAMVYLFSLPGGLGGGPRHRATTGGALGGHSDRRRKFLSGFTQHGRLLQRFGPADFRHRAVETQRQYHRRTTLPPG